MKRYFSRGIAGLFLFIVFIFLKIDLLCFIGLTFIVIGIQEDCDYKNIINYLLAVAVTLVGILILYIEFKFDYCVIALYLIVLIGILTSNFIQKQK